MLLTVLSLAAFSQVPADDFSAAEPFGWRALGPSTFGGRIIDLALHPDRPHTLWVASASGGLWVTRDHGTKFECLFESEGTISIGDIAVSPADPDVLWIGTGEANNQRSSYWGDGVYKSTDSGETWANMGLPDSHHIGRIVIDPTDQDTVFVAALGHLYTPNDERGLYRTKDGGETWENVLDQGPDVGVVDVAIDPENPKRLIAATYERRRRAWDFDGNGPGSAIWRSLDGGDTWEKCEGKLPTGDIGRIGVAVFPGNTDVVAATVANQNQVPIERGPIVGIEVRWEDGLEVTRVRRGSAAAEVGVKKDDVIVAIGETEIDGPFDWMRLLEDLLAASEEGADKGDKESSADPIKVVVEREVDGKTERVTLEVSAEALAKPDDRAPQTREVGGEVWVSTDFGATWEQRNDDPVGGSPAYYYGQIRFDPKDEKRMYMCSVPFLTTTDGGINWTRIARSVHVDHHAVAVDPSDSNKVWLGNDGGLHLSYDRGESWQHFTNIPISQFYAVGLDSSEPFRVYGGTQDNGTWGGPHTSRDPKGIHPFEWETVGGGDGFYAQIDPREPNIVFAESQFGAIYRRDLRTGTSVRIRPRKPEDAEEESLRFNWNSPILMSAHNSSVIYFGGNRLFKSFDRGTTWSVHSPDLTTKDADKIAGNVPHCTITTVAESKLDPGILLVGTDDGLVHLSRDGGYDWTNLTGQFPGVPSNWWVSRVALSTHDKNRAWVTFTGYREDDFRPFVYATDELGSGKGWQLISGDLPAGEPVNDIVEDPQNPDVLYVATEFGVSISFDRGASWQRLGAGLPRVAVHDLEVQDRDGVLVAATHGRGFWALEIDALRAVDQAAISAGAHLFPVGDVVLWARRATVGGYGGGDQVWRGTNETREVALFVRRTEAAQDCSLEIENEQGNVVAKIDVPDTAGLHALRWDMRRSGSRGARRVRSTTEGRYVAKLTWTVAASTEGDDAEGGAKDGKAKTLETRQSFRIRRDPMLENASPAEMEAERAQEREAAAGKDD